MTEKDLALLLRRYYEGATSPAEEAALRRYFRRPEADVPPRWRGEQAYFRALDEARPAAVPPQVSRRIGDLLDRLAKGEAPAAAFPAGKEPNAPRASQNMLRRIRLHRALWKGGMAACLLLALAFGWQRLGRRPQPAEPPMARAELPSSSPSPATAGTRPHAPEAQPASPSSPAAPACKPRPAAKPAPRPTPEELAQVRRGLQLYAEALRKYRESLAAIDRQVRHTEAELQASVRQARALCATAREGHRELLGRSMESGQETHRKLQEIIQQLNP